MIYGIVTTTLVQKNSEDSFCYISVGTALRKVDLLEAVRTFITGASEEKDTDANDRVRHSDIDTIGPFQRNEGVRNVFTNIGSGVPKTGSTLGIVSVADASEVSAKKVQNYNI